jgi:hypothetical protein
MDQLHARVEPITFVADHLAGLMNSHDLHDLRGAVAGAGYLNQQDPRADGADDLQAATRNLLEQERTVASGDVSELFHPMLARFLLSVHLPRSLTSEDRAFAHLALTQYKVATYDTVSERAVSEGFNAAMAVVPRPRRTEFLHDHIRPYYQRLLGQETLTPNQQTAVRIGRTAARWQSPAFFMEDRGDRAKYERALQRSN